MALFLLAAMASCVKERGHAAGNFSTGSLEGWNTRVFSGETRYRLVERDGTTVLEGASAASASGLFMPMEVDLGKFPILNWSWLATALLQGNNERTKAGDDFVARIFVIVPGPDPLDDPVALNYVWARSEPVEASWANPFVMRAAMVVVESGPDRLGEWVRYRRDVREDMRRFLNMEPTTVLAVAVMVDTDNTGQAATSYFGDIYFTDK